MKRCNGKKGQRLIELFSGTTSDEIEPFRLTAPMSPDLSADEYRQALERAYEQSLTILEPEHMPSPETRLLVLEALDAVGQVLDGLGSKVREIFLLSQLDGLTYPQIAERMDLTVNVVQKAMLKAYRHCYLAVYAG